MNAQQKSDIHRFVQIAERLAEHAMPGDNEAIALAGRVLKDMLEFGDLSFQLPATPEQIPEERREEYQKHTYRRALEMIGRYIQDNNLYSVTKEPNRMRGEPDITIHVLVVPFMRDR